MRREKTINKTAVNFNIFAEGTPEYLFPTLDSIREAHERIRPLIHRTPVLTSKSINAITGSRIFFKCENFQKIGAFKIRGGANALLTLDEALRRHGVTTYSSGNHAQALALAGKAIGIKVFIVMPKSSKRAKVNAVLGYGAEVFFCEQSDEETFRVIEKVIRDTGAAYIDPFNDYRVIEGQATVTKELLEDVHDLDVIIGPVGGGGLMSGACLITQYLSPSTEISIAEPTGCDDTDRSLKAGARQPVGAVNTIADGLLSSIGDKTFPIIQKYVRELFLVSDEEIVEAMRLVWERMKIIIEPSSAVPVAAVLKNKEKFKDKRVGLILTGGNVDLANLPF